jgi:hypothetical protein
LKNNKGSNSGGNTVLKFKPMIRSLRVLYFTLLTTLLVPATAQPVDYSKSYINVTRKTSGGAVQPGDVLEIRFTFFVRNGTVADSCGVFDNVPAGTTLITDSMMLRTNEGLQFRPRYTNAQDADPGTVTGTAIKIHLGTGASAARRGRITGATDKPRFYTVGCIIMATYRIRVNPAVAFDSVINVGGGSLTYKIGSAAISVVNYPATYIKIYRDYGTCQNSVGANAIVSESNGTFGSGRNKNRGPSAVVPANYTYSLFAANTPNDYFYGVSNNSSGNYGTSNSIPYPDGTNKRVFGVWDIIGDHTNAAIPANGNPATDTVPAAANGGYMAVINASYRTDSAFSQVITNLCPNTYYEYSAWFYNICRYCACDSSGRGAFGTGFNGPDSSGVNPNLTFVIDGVDYYSSGNMTYSKQWVKKGFTYLTGPVQTSMRVTIRNNAPGGGGNDWAIDDISVRLCGPDISFFAYPLYNVCDSNVVDSLSATVRSFFNNYTRYLWEKSTNGGVTWTPTGVTGTGTPVLTGGMWQYTVTYPPFIAYPADNGTKFRLKVATTAANLGNSNCSYINATQNTTLNVLTCIGVLPITLSDLSVFEAGNVNILRWNSQNETGPMQYSIEKSTNGFDFSETGRVNGVYGTGTARYYSFTDAATGGTQFYRLRVTDLVTGRSQYSNIVFIDRAGETLQILQYNNPFNAQVSLQCAAPEAGLAQLFLHDQYGREVKKQVTNLQQGMNQMILPGTASLKSGIYILRLKSGATEKIIRLLKQTD